MKTRPLAIFCKHSSLRGVARAYHSRGFLRVAWSVYVFLMVGLLLSSVVRLCMNYIGYHTIIQTNVQYEEPEVFPAVTVCPHHPFSSRALHLWANDSILSPGNYSLGLKRLIRQVIHDGEFASADTLLQHDLVQSYYQSMSLQQAMELGLRERELFVHCHIKTSDHRSNRAGSLSECGATAKVWSHPRHFNCFIVRVATTISKDVSSLLFILRLQKKIHSLHTGSAFAQDVFEKAYGARIAIHEPGEHPNFQRGGFHVEPGKMVDVSFRVVRWIEADTPKDKCVDHQTSIPQQQLPLIQDLDIQFAYNRITCINNKIADYVLRKCNCLLANYPRPFKPTKQTPYCSHIDLTVDRIARKRMIERFRCRAGINISKLRKEFHETCDNPCHTLEYDLHVTSTQWSPTTAQIHWLMTLTDLFREATVNRSMGRILHYLHGENITAQTKELSFLGEEQGAEYAFVVLSRDNFNTVLRQEKLIITFDGLLSRLGGICSLSLGLSFAFVVELVELVFKIMHGESTQTRCQCGKEKDEVVENNHKPPQPQATREPESDSLLSDDQV